MNPKGKLILGFLCLWLVLAGCNTLTMEVSLANPVEGKSPIPEKTVIISNCSTLEEMHRSLAEEAQVIQTIHISDTASRIDHREKLQLNDSLKKKLSTNIEKTYQAHLDEAIEKVHQTDLVIPGQRIRHFTISWKQQTYHSEILFEIDNQRYVATYTCTFEIPEALQSAELICTG